MTKPIKLILGAVTLCLLVAVVLVVMSASRQDPLLWTIAMILFAVAAAFAVLPLLVAVVILLIEKFTRK